MDSAYYAIDNIVSPVIAMSYGTCEYNEAFYGGSSGEGSFASDETELKKANTEGITFVNSSDDSGAAGCDPNGTDPNNTLATGGLAVSYPASSPEVTGVGGTATTISEITTDASTYWSLNNGSTGGSALTYIPEAPWNDDAEFGAYCAANLASTFCTDYEITNFQTAQAAFGIGSTGGGPSNCTALDVNGDCTGGFAKPPWQTVTISGVTSARFVPDVSLLASPNFPSYIFCTQLSELDDAGTGSSCAPGGADGIENALFLSPFTSVAGGTSASAQVFGSMVVLVNQYLVKTGVQSAPGLGNINPNLYQIAITDPAAFHRVTASDYAANPGSNEVYCSPGTPGVPPGLPQCPAAVPPATEGLFGYLSANADAATGYNLVTGLGSVDLNELATVWESSKTVPSFTWTTTSTSHTVLAGQTTLAYNFTATPTGGATTFAAQVTFSCGFSPADPTLTNNSCVFTPPSIPVGASETAVSMTITSTGPNTGTGTAVRRRADNRSPWLPLTLPIAGVVMLGLMRGKVSRKVSKRSAIALLCFSLALVGFMVACGGSSTSAPPPPVSVTVTPSSTVNLYADEAGNSWPASATQQQFTATVNNSSNQTVTWAVTGGSANGTISSTGLYTSPATVPNPATVTVTATSSAATTPGSGTVDILTPTAVGTFTVTVTATERDGPSESQQVTLIVQ